MTYYGFKATKDGKEVFIEWFWDEENRDRIVSKLEEGFKIENKGKRKEFLWGINIFCSPIMDEESLSFEKIQTSNNIFLYSGRIGNEYYVECNEHLMKNVGREINSFINKNMYTQICVFNNLDDETVDIDKRFDSWAYSDIYVTYLNTEYGYNFVRTIPIGNEYYAIEDNFDKISEAKYYIDNDKGVIICFSKCSKRHLRLYSLHREIVNKVIKFCIDYNIENIDEFQIMADGLQESIKDGHWTPYTDSSFSLINNKGKQVMLSI